MFEHILIKIIHFSLVVLLLALCSVSNPSRANAESLWKKSKKETSRMLFTDTKASHIGDIVTILISEGTKSEYKNEAENKKKSSVLSTVTSLIFPAAASPASSDELNNSKRYTGSRVGMHNGTLPSSKWSGDQSFKGNGSSKNESTVEARIAARVIAVLPNENLLLEGKRSVMVGEEEEIIILSGIVRKEDITPLNTVESQYLADAKIKIQGKGPAAISQKKGVLTKVWEFLGIY
ncbi:MAG: flagellar basal body L-ring protein FlgH [Candidatus Aureabacteria bacterium]|nr:flagellar basal body L-ring protein FlgH [Candidatus Auribacterota bacterium]